jgi:hypothetical protein
MKTELQRMQERSAGKISAAKAIVRQNSDQLSRSLKDIERQKVVKKYCH